MQVNLNNLVSISEVNQNFSKVARMVDEKGAAVIMKNNSPKYVLVGYSTLMEEAEVVDDVTLEEVANEVLTTHIKAFKELAK